jgi:hypothetical protein
LASFDKEINALENDKRLKKQDHENSKLESQQLGHDRQNLVSDLELAKRETIRLVKENPWIPDQKVNFGKKNTDFYFEGQDIAACHKSLKIMEENHSKLYKKLDEDVMQKYDRYYDLKLERITI